MKLLLSIFTLSLLDCNHSYTGTRWVSSSNVRVDKLLWLNLQVRVLSSANKVNLKNSEHLGKSFMNIRNSKGPRVDP